MVQIIEPLLEICFFSRTIGMLEPIKNLNIQVKCNKKDDSKTKPIIEKQNNHLAPSKKSIRIF